MNRETQDKLINISSGALTLLVIAGIAFFSISSYQKIQQSSSNEEAVKISDENRVAKSERIDTKEVENELNKLAEQKRLEEARIAAEKRAREKAEQERIAAEKRAAEKAAAEKAAREKAERDRIAAEKQAAAKKEADRIAAVKAAEAKAVAEKVAREKAAEEKHVAEKQAAEKKAQEAKAAEKRAADAKAEEARKASEKQEADKKAADKKAADEKAARERADKERAEKERLAAEKKAADQKAADAKKEADRKAAEAQKAEEATRIAAALTSDYFAKVQDYLYTLWIPPSGSYGLTTTIQFKVKEDGSIIGTPVISRESGNDDFDNSVFVAIMSAGKVPMPDDPVVRKYLAKEGFEIRFKPTN